MSKKEEFYFTSANGVTSVHAVKWVPDSGTYDAVLQITHGMCEHIARYDEFASYLSARGFLVVGHDHVGHGKSVRSPEEYGYFASAYPSDILVEDIHKVRTMTQQPDMPYFMMGHSMGSYLLRKYLSEHGSGLAGAVLMGTGFVPQVSVNFGLAVATVQGLIQGQQHRSKLLRKLSYTSSYRGFDSYGHDYSKSWLTKDEAAVKEFFEDPMCTFTFTCNGYKGLFEAVSFSCKKKNAKKIPQELPILLISGDNDPVGDMGVGVRKTAVLYESVGIKDVSVKLYVGNRHELLHEINKAVIFSDIDAWLKLKK